MRFAILLVDIDKLTVVMDVLLSRHTWKAGKASSLSGHELTIFHIVSVSFLVKAWIGVADWAGIINIVKIRHILIFRARCHDAHFYAISVGVQTFRILWLVEGLLEVRPVLFKQFYEFWAAFGKQPARSVRTSV